jgi:hypothetical protein
MAKSVVRDWPSSQLGQGTPIGGSARVLLELPDHSV